MVALLGPRRPILHTATRREDRGGAAAAEEAEDLAAGEGRFGGE
jgi:hypothetical protein